VPAVLSVAILPIFLMRQSTRLIVNSISTIGRMVLTIVIGLLVTRLLVQYLGKVDF
jgi:hypothetical protein